jgi:hypothetical protein
MKHLQVTYILKIFTPFVNLTKNIPLPHHSISTLNSPEGKGCWLETKVIADPNLIDRQDFGEPVKALRKIRLVMSGKPQNGK